MEAAERTEKMAMRKFGARAALLLSTSPLSRILFPIPQIVTRFKHKERNRQQQDDREEYADGKIFSSARHVYFTFLSPSQLHAVANLCNFANCPRFFP
jgi:hypothetical protein